MNAQDLTLNIAVNLDRLSRFATERRAARVDYFLKDTEYYVEQLAKSPKSPRFQPTFLRFRSEFGRLKRTQPDEVWAEDALTWANILTHRAKLA